METDVTMAFTVKLLKKDKLTHDVIQLTLERPANYSFAPGQYTELSLALPSKPVEKAPFSFIGLNSDPDVQVALKTTPVNPEVNAHLRRLEQGDEVQISEPQNEVEYHGPGVFIAGGTGITPFMAIFRQLYKDGKLGGNRLIYANKRGEDICFEGELYTMFGTDFISILALEDRPRNASGEIDAGFLEQHVKNVDQPFHVCGPEPFVNQVADALHATGVEDERIALYNGPIWKNGPRRRNALLL